MDYKTDRKNFPRDSYFRDRIESIKPRLNNIIGWEFDREHLRRMREDDKRIEKINRDIDDYINEKHVYIKIDGDDEARRGIDTKHLTVKQCSTETVRTKAVLQKLCVPIIMVHSDKGHKELTTEIQERMAKYPEVVRKGSVIVLLTNSHTHEAIFHQRVQEIKKCLESDKSNFEVDKCVVTLKSHLDRIESDSYRPITRQLSREGKLKRLSGELTLNTSADNISNDLSETSSPAKRLHTHTSCSVSVDMSKTSSELSVTGTKSDSSSSGASCCLNRSSSSDESTIANNEFDIARAISHQLVCKAIDIVESIEDFLLDLKHRRDTSAKEKLFTELDKFLFELLGLYNNSDTKIGRERMKEYSISSVPSELSSDLLKLEHVKGFGRIYGKLAIHVDATIGEEELESVNRKIAQLTVRHNYKANYSISSISQAPYPYRKDVVISRG